MIQRTAIWILATFALCSPGTVVIHQTRAPIGAAYQVWSVQIGSPEARQTASRLVTHPATASREPLPVFSEPDSATASRLYFGSLYNRPPPASLSFS